MKDIVIRGGYNVYPGEVEAVLLEHPNVDQCAVVGRPDLHYGEEVVAFVVRRAGHETSEAELIAWAKARLAGYKYPRSIIWRDELPRNATGKTLKTVLRSAFSPMED